MNIIYKTPDAENNHIAYKAVGNKITLGDDELTLNLARYEQDDAKHIDICLDATGCLVMGTSTGRKYIAEIDIPSRKYTESKKGDEITAVPVPFNINNCTLTLWATD
ncbi:MAG: hypothetical protein RR365_00725 [Bacteroides sp.]